MEKKGKVVMKVVLLTLVLSVTLFRGCFAAANQRQLNKKNPSSSSMVLSADRIGSTALFQVIGNVYPIGYYYVALNVGNPPKPYFLDMDTGSDLTWLQCDAPCVSCSKVPHPLYRPNKNGIVFCTDPICTSLSDNICDKPQDQCDYEVEYADLGSSMGVLVRDVFPLPFINGSILGPHVAFGCGYDQRFPSRTESSPTDGVLGLGNGKSSIVSQLRNMGLVRNVIGHCLSGKKGGFLFIGDDIVPTSGLVWTPMSRSSSNNHYSPGSAELVFGKQSTGVKGPLIFDSGSTYTYFNSQAYQALISLLTKDLAGTPLKRVVDKNLPVCWKGAKPFKSILDVKQYFKPVILSLTNGNKVQLEIPPEAYLIITSYGNVCLGILNGSEIGISNENIIGDISLQDQIVIYDNERQKIGWGPADCSRSPKPGKFFL